MRLWQEDPDPYLTGGVNLVPLAPLTNVTEADLPGLVRRMDRRINPSPSRGRTSSGSPPTADGVALRGEAGDSVAGRGVEHARIDDLSGHPQGGRDEASGGPPGQRRGGSCSGRGPGDSVRPTRRSSPPSRRSTMSIASSRSPIGSSTRRPALERSAPGLVIGDPSEHRGSVRGARAMDESTMSPAERH